MPRTRIWHISSRRLNQSCVILARFIHPRAYGVTVETFPRIFDQRRNFIVHLKVETTGFSRSALAARISCMETSATWNTDTEAIRYFKMIKQYLEHHFEPRPTDDLKMEPE